MALTDTAVKNLKPQGKPFTRTDGLGLSLLVTPAGGKLWRFRYQFNGKANMLGLGQWPDISLNEVRERRNEARKLLAHGVDPSEARKAEKATRKAEAANSFEAVTLEWFTKWSADKADTYAPKVISALKTYAFPWIGARPIAEITAPEVLAVLRRIEERGFIERARRVKIDISQVMRYAIATGRRVERDPCPDLKGAMQTRTAQHMAALTKPADVATLLRAIDDYQTTPHASIVTCAALKP